jgi:hypothetical protein
MSSRLDIVRSLLRDGAERLVRYGMSSPLSKRLSSVLGQRLFVSDERLTRAVAHAPGVAAATVSTRAECLRIETSYHDGSALSIRLTPLSVKFAPQGAKEWTLRVIPEDAARDPRSAEIVAALASEVARTLWGPLMRKQRAASGMAFAHREDDRLIMDLRTLPEVRSALSQRVSAAAMDAFGLHAVSAVDGGLRLVPGLPSMPPL